jgi:hypothetical protein
MNIDAPHANRVDFDVSQGLKLFTDPNFRHDVMTRVMPSASHAHDLGPLKTGGNRRLMDPSSTPRRIE